MDPADAVAARVDTARRVGSALDRLSDSDRELLQLQVWEDLAHDDIAYVLGCSTATLRVRLRRARMRFADHLRDVDSETGGPARPPHPTTEKARP